MYIIQTVSSTRVGGRSSEGPVSAQGHRADYTMEARTAWPPKTQESQPKKDNSKWSIGKLFRRKKKESDGDTSSSEDNSQKYSKRKTPTKSKRKTADQIVVDVSNDHKRSQSVTKFQHRDYYDEGVLSDPSAGFVGFVGRGLPRSPLNMRTSKESLDKKGQGSSCGSQDGSLRKGRKGRIKARIEAMRNVKNDSSSDEESQRSTSSSIIKFRSDDSLTNYSRDGSVNRRTRSARTDRYNKRLSRDDEAQLNQEADLIQKGFSRSEAELIALKQRVLSTPSINGETGWPKEEPDYSEPKIMQQPSNGINNQYGNLMAKSNQRPGGLSGSNSSMYSYPTGVINFNAQVNNENITYSVPFNNAKNNQERPEVRNSKLQSRRSASVENTNGLYSTPNYENDNVMVVKFPLGMNPPKKDVIAPPVPPPRDLQRKGPTPISSVYENTRPLMYEQNSQRFSQPRTREDKSATPTPASYNPQSVYDKNIQINNPSSLNWSKRPISTSEDHIAMQQNYYNSPSTDMYQNDQPRRPSSVTAEVIRPEVYNRYLARPQLKQLNLNRDSTRRHTQENTNPEFLYFADKTPRSRKPIHIAKSPANPEQLYLSDSQASSVNQGSVRQRPRNASDFWKKMETQELMQKRKQFGHNRSLSDQSTTSASTQNKYVPKPQNPIVSNPIKNNFMNGSIQNGRSNESIGKNPYQRYTKDEVDNVFRKNKKEDEPICYSNIDIIPMDDVRKNSDEDQSKSRRKSTNLDDALSELEAIYNSLGLGDEDLLDRAERRELMTPKTTESFPYSSPTKENYFRYPSYSDYADTPVVKRQQQMHRKSSIPDKLHDDMAYRRMNPHERPKSDANNLVSQVSYMLATPALADPVMTTSLPPETGKEEPDVLLDDVVFRNIRQANNYLKIEDPQPPFGIPLGPVSPAPFSDYLHANPESKHRSRYIPQEIPDIVTDDLAYRTLRKDSKNPNANDDLENVINNNCDNKSLSQPSKLFDNHVIKKKRAVRSLSANIFTIIQREIDDAISLYSNRGVEKAQSIPDLPESVLEYGKSGKLPANFKTSQQLLDQLDIQKPVRPTSKYENESGESPRDIFFREERLAARPPLAVTPDKSPKSTTPNYKKSLSPRRKTTDNFEDALNIMAKEAKETSVKLGQALEKLKNEKKESKGKHKRETRSEHKYGEDKSHHDVKSDSQSTFVTKFQNDDGYQKSNDSHEVVETKVKSSCIPNIVFDSNVNKKSEQNLSNENRGKFTEDSLMTISNQLKMVGNKIKANIEKSEANLEDNAALDMNKYNNKKQESRIFVSDSHQIVEHRQPVESKYNAVASNMEPFSYTSKMESNFSKCPMLKKEKPFDSKIESLDNLHSFDDLRKGISELLDDITHVTDKFAVPKPTEESQAKKKETDGKESPIDVSSQDEVEKNRNSRESPEYNSSEELAMIFKLNKDSEKAQPKNEATKEIVEESHHDLNSPRLVNNANQNFRKMSVEEKQPIQPKAEMAVVPVTEAAPQVPWRSNRRQTAVDNAGKGSCHDDACPDKTGTWFRDPGTLFLACSYTLACTQLDVLTILAILLAMISIIAMLVL